MSYKTSNNYNTVLNKVVNEWILADQTDIVNHLLSQSYKYLISHSDIRNQYYYVAQDGAKTPEGDEITDTKYYLLPESEQQFYSENTNEIFEWWLVQSCMVRMLLDRNQPMIITEYGSWWGRTSKGIELQDDPVLQDIAKNSVYIPC